MEQTHWKWVSRIAPRQPRRGGRSGSAGTTGRSLRSVWLDSDAVHAAELCAEAAGVPVARFIDSMLFEICAGTPPPRKASRGLRKGETRRPAQVIRIDRLARR